VHQRPSATCAAQLSALSIAFLVALAVSVVHADELVLSGLPSTKIESTAETTSRVQLSPALAEEYGAIIVKRGGGYLEVEASLGGEPVDYYEHVDLGLATITYWGKSPTFSP